MIGPVPSVDDLVEAALSSDSGLDPRSSQEPEKVASGEPTEICDVMEKVAGELEDWAMSQMEGAEELEEKMKNDWALYQQGQMFKIALTRTLTETVAAVSDSESLRDANWGETIKEASAEKTSTSKKSLFVAAQARAAKAVESAAEPVKRTARASKPKTSASPWRTAAAVGIPAAAAGGYAARGGSNGS